MFIVCIDVTQDIKLKNKKLQIKLIILFQIITFRINFKKKDRNIKLLKVTKKRKIVILYKLLKKNINIIHVVIIGYSSRM